MDPEVEFAALARAIRAWTKHYTIAEDNAWQTSKLCHDMMGKHPHLEVLLRARRTLGVVERLCEHKWRWFKDEDADVRAARVKCALALEAYEAALRLAQSDRVFVFNTFYDLRTGQVRIEQEER